MDYFHYKNHQLYAENVAVTAIAEQYGTPVYIYSAQTLTRHWHAFDDELSDYPHLICYAVKANSTLAILQVMARLGSGFDIVSVGELERVLIAGGAPNKIVFSGVGKLTHEIERALDVGIMSFNVESQAELLRIETIAQQKNIPAPISIRLNPNVDAQTHPYIATGLKENKFGVSIEQAIQLFQYAATSAHLKVVGIDCHIGSQLTSLQPFLDALDCVLNVIQQLKLLGITVQHLNLGGGIGVTYIDETPPHPRDYCAALKERLREHSLTLILEPGRAIVANAGILVTRVEYLKTHQDKHFAIVDAAMNDLLRPAIYSAKHAIIPVLEQPNSPQKTYDIVGPVCETGDFLGKDRPLSIQASDLLAVRTAGAYCFSMSSNYNSRTRVAEILVTDNMAHLIREREPLESLYQFEHLLSDEI